LANRTATARTAKIGADEAASWLETARLETRTLIAQSWRAALAANGEFAEDFYRRVFAADPAAAALFPGDMTEQKKLLTRTMSMAVELVDDPAALLLLLRASGVRHAHYGVAPRQFEVIGAALIATVADRAGPLGFSSRHREAWDGFYAAISAIMRDGMRKAANA
jgi:hemoglobin-like flavoprotein